MYERCLTEAERVLVSHKDVIVPVREVWDHVRKRCNAIGAETATLADFTAMLEADPRFELLPAQKEEAEFEQALEEEDSEMGQLGFFPEDRVKLRRIKILREDEQDEAATIVKGLSATTPVAMGKKNGKRASKKLPKPVRRRTTSKKPARPRTPKRRTTSRSKARSRKKSR